MRFLHLLLLTWIFTGCTEKNDPPTSDEGKIIVLMYHRLVEGEPEDTYERSAADFESDLLYLKNNNINVIDFDDLETIISSGKMPAEHSAIITFDDGDCSWYSLTRPLLLKHRLTATFFLWTAMIGNNSFLTWNEVEYMANFAYPGGKRPFLFGSHTFSHPFLQARRSAFSDINEYNAFLDYELRVSKEAIEKHIPEEVNVLALPYGDGAGDADIISAAMRNGYKFIRTSIWGAVGHADINPYILPSLPMLNDSSTEDIGYYLFDE